MKMRIIYATLMLAIGSSASAQGLNTGYCTTGKTFFVSNEEACRAAGGAFRALGALTITGNHFGLTTHATSPSCPLDRTSVMLGGGLYKCAKDLTDPE